MFLEEENVGITIIVDRTREKFLFISHLVAFMYLESTKKTVLMVHFSKSVIAWMSRTQTELQP